MIRLLLLALLFFLAYTVYTALVQALPRRHDSSLPREKTRRGEDMVQDPRCGTYIPRNDAVEKTIKGKLYFFCSKECRDAFVAGD